MSNADFTPAADAPSRNLFNGAIANHVDLAEALEDVANHLVLLSELYGHSIREGGYPTLEREEARNGMYLNLSRLAAYLDYLSGRVAYIFGDVDLTRAPFDGSHVV